MAPSSVVDPVLGGRACRDLRCGDGPPTQGPPAGRPRRRAGDAPRDQRAHARAARLPGRREVVRLLPQRAPRRRGRGDRPAARGRDRVLGRRRADQGRARAGPHDAVVHDRALPGPPLRAAARVPHRRAHPRRAGRGRAGRLALARLADPGPEVARGARRERLPLRGAFMSAGDLSGLPDRFVPTATWLRSFATGTPGVVAAYLGGSLATDRVDADSDLDGQVMVEPGRAQEVFDAMLTSLRADWQVAGLWLVPTPTWH